MVIDKVRLVFVLIYIVVDVMYVYLSSAAYADAIKAISGQTKGLLIYAPFAWICMAVGWYFFGAPTALKWVPTMGPLLAGLASGLLLGLTIIGTYGFTTVALFARWDRILWRDLAWGISWITISITAYTLWTTHNRIGRRKA